VHKAENGYSITGRLSCKCVHSGFSSVKGGLGRIAWT